jgi:protein-S-isoprenylcysteine O-methyltransferase Ste14
MSIFNTFAIFWIFVALISFVYLFFVNAPYGRHMRQGWGKSISARTGWVIMESPCVILMILYGLLMINELLLIHIIFLLLWLTHYIHRSFIYPFAIDLTNPKMPISIAASAFFFNIVNVNIQAIGIYYFTSYPENWISTNTFLIGVLIFLIGMFINIKSDYLIISMRKENGPGYHMPNKFLHKYISSPNYFGEIIEWIGWAILTWSISGVVFAIWTIANLFPRALAHHKWYQKKFSEYPKNRKAIIPGII